VRILLEALDDDLEAAMSALGVDAALWRKVIGPARERAEGDVALPCFPFAKAVGQSPADIASALAERLGDHPALLEARASNGYLNLVANPAWLLEHVLAPPPRNDADGPLRLI
jgi:arginyl-tRNA synthetase